MQHVVNIASLTRQSASASPADAKLSLDMLKGRLVEVSGRAAPATLTMAMHWVLEAQREGELAAWIEPPEHGFFPPDAADIGIDLAALPVVHAPAAACPRAAEHLLRSGAFALIVIDMTTTDLPTAAQSRLLGLAQKHTTAVVCLSDKTAEAESFGSLFSLRMHTIQHKRQGDLFSVDCAVLKDKTGRWHHQTHSQVFYGPAGMR